jgi:hypothetical protein
MHIPEFWLNVSKLAESYKNAGLIEDERTRNLRNNSSRCRYWLSASWSKTWPGSRFTCPISTP